MRQLDSITNSMDMNLNKKKGDSGGQKNLVCSSLWGCKELDVTQQPNNYSIYQIRNSKRRE